LIKEGEKAPDFTLQSDDNKEVSLSDYRGKKVVLYFYPKDGTAGCTQEAIEFRDLAQEFEKEGITILGVSKDSIKSHQNFKQKHGLPFVAKRPGNKSFESVWRLEGEKTLRTNIHGN
jgi:peroxiredoxin Q/BCP